jgi:DHA1 family tetracycline resistance protein-like MFS transporter
MSEPATPTPSSKGILFVIFLTVFLDLVGFGMVIPILPIYAHDNAALGWEIGVIMGVYSLMQFVCSPLWGRWSDRIGRRKPLLIGTMGATLSYMIFALGSGIPGRLALLVFFASRVMAGFFGANLSVAQAAIADITPPALRSRRMGLIGMAFGLGFILGPWLGGVSLKHFGVAGPGWVATAFCALNFLLALVLLPETLKSPPESSSQRPQLAQWTHTLGQPQVGLVVIVFFLSTFAFACFETTLGLLVSHNFNLDYKGRDATKIGNLFMFTGFIGVLAQGGMYRPLLKRMGEAGLIAMCLLLYGASLAAMPWVTSWGPLLGWLAVLGVASSLARPPIFGLISRLTPASEQGATLGVTHSAGSLARIAGPVFAGSLFSELHPHWPYVACAAMALFTFGVIVVKLLPAMRAHAAANPDPPP